MQIAQQIIFLLISVAAIWFFTKKAREIIRNIRLGRDEDFSDNKAKRWNNVLLLAFGQKKMFRNPLVAILHFFVYAGFIIINIEVLEIIIDGLFGTHRLFAAPLGGFYTFLINAFEILALLVLSGCLIFLVRRNILRLRR
ncbi:MAG TPA: Fe-S oxidoreductase, partial [Chitinophagaceae bacterium]